MYRVIGLLLLLVGIHCSSVTTTQTIVDLGGGGGGADLGGDAEDLAAEPVDLSTPAADMRSPQTPKACSAEGWCWEHPLPEGSTRLEVWAADANNAWAVGHNGVIVKWDGTAWLVQRSGTTNQLNGVWGTDTNNVWAVGNGGTVLKWNGTAWGAQGSGTLNAFYGV